LDGSHQQAAARTRQAEAIATARRTAALKLVDEGKALAGSDIPAAYRKLRSARDLDPKIAGVTELMDTLLQQARAIGEEALSDGKNYENGRRRDDAIRSFERALQHLEIVPGHPGVAIAKERLGVLRPPK
jgi:hypothetical protein